MMEADSPERLCEGGAAAVLNMAPGASISVAYHPQFGPHDDLMLLEVDEKLLPDVLHQRVALRGQQEEDAVLCTESKTYAVKFVGTSNSVFLVPPSEQYEIEGKCGGELGLGGKVRASVLKVAQGCMELVEIAPRIDKLKNLLLERPYMSSDVEMGDSGEEMGAGLYGWGDLVEMVQASDEELRRGLEVLSAVEIDGFWRVVDEQYMDLILNMLLHNIVLNDWSFDALNESEVMEVLKSDGFSPDISLHCLKVFGHRTVPDLGSSIWSLEEKKVCVHFARKVLRGGKKKMDAFMEEWVKKIPKGMHVSFDMLEGEVLTEQFGIDTWVRSFSVSSLPYNPTERFTILFKEQAKWEFKDLQPYISDLSVPGSSLEDLLLKYTRRTQASVDSEPVFSAR
uniref:Sister chromatid cohesion protein DCC1 n=1 Tax=Kalanchoe fedtschenkoi TaxID=63787 RepID=A0A7N0V8B1_KALFE